MNAPSGSRAPSERFLQESRTIVQNMLVNVPGMHSVLLASTDGFELASAYKGNGLAGGKVAAVSSSILALVEAFVGEIGLNGCHSMSLEAENGKAFIASIAAPHHPMVLVIITNYNVLIGQVFHTIRETTGRLIELDRQLG